jgi:D-arabinose 1-dehydrogenase-like Zn-dependent alcohol dehydrogenase
MTPPELGIEARRTSVWSNSPAIGGRFGGRVKAACTVGIIGFGGLGQIGGRVAVLTGADVYVAEINERVWQSALDAGVKDVRTSITEFQDVSFDVIIDFAGFGTTTADAINVVRRGGRVVQVGMGCLEATISTASLILRQVTLIGSLGGTRHDVEGGTNTSLLASSHPRLPRSVSKRSRRVSHV